MRSGICALALVAFPVLAVATSINTYPTWNGTDTISYFGNPNTSTYGEAITTPSGVGTVTAFSFWLAVPAGFEFQAFISPWDNNNYELTGSLLFESAVITAANSNLDEYTVIVPNAAVTSGTIYMFGVTVDNYYSADAGMTGSMGGDIYANGNSTYYFAWNNDSGNFSSNYSNWNSEEAGCASNTGACGQAAFLVTYGTTTFIAPPTPEPGTMLLGATGLLGLGFMRLRKARR